MTWSVFVWSVALYWKCQQHIEHCWYQVETCISWNAVFFQSVQSTETFAVLESLLSFWNGPYEKYLHTNFHRPDVESSHADSFGCIFPCFDIFLRDFCFHPNTMNVSLVVWTAYSIENQYLKKQCVFPETVPLIHWCSKRINWHHSCPFFKYTFTPVVT